MIELPVRSTFLTLGQVALGVIAVVAGLVLIAGPRGSARLIGVVAAVSIAIGAVWLIRGLRRQAIILDGSRLGWRGGLTDKVVGWTDLDDVELASTARMSSSITRKHPDVILWTTSGGLTGVRSLLLDRQFPPQMRTGRGTRGASGVELQPFIVPFSAFAEEDRARVRAMLDERGLLPR